MLRQRLITGALLIAALLGLAWLDTQLPIWRTDWGRIGPGFVLALAVIVIIAPLMAREMAALTRGGSPVAHALAIIGGALAIFLPRTPEQCFFTYPYAFMGIAALMLLSATLHARKPSCDGAARAIAGPLASLALVGIPLGFWLLLRREHEAWTLAGAILCVKVSDIGAYFTGKAIGRRKLIPRLSPGKTWEGFLGGLIAGTVFGALLGLASQQAVAGDELVEPISTTRGAIAGLCFAIVGVAGDLLESMLKRDAGVKDSGAILPGMGGIFDVLDSLLLAGPVAWWLLS